MLEGTSCKHNIISLTVPVGACELQQHDDVDETLFD